VTPEALEPATTSRMLSAGLTIKSPRVYRLSRVSMSIVSIVSLLSIISMPVAPELHRIAPETQLA